MDKHKWDTKIVVISFYMFRVSVCIVIFTWFPFSTLSYITNSFILLFHFRLAINGHHFQNWRRKTQERNILCFIYKLNFVFFLTCKFYRLKTVPFSRKIIIFRFKLNGTWNDMTQLSDNHIQIHTCMEGKSMES